VLFSAAIVLSARLRFTESAAGGLDREYRIHHWVGGLAFAFLALHPTLLAWRYAQVGWRRAGQLWSPSDSELAVIAGQLSLYGMAIAIVLTVYATVRYQVLVWTQRVLGALYLPAAYHVLYAGGDVSVDSALRWYMTGVLSLGACALVFHTILGRFLSRHYRFRMSDIRELPAHVTELKLRPDGRAMPFVPGQFGYLRFSHETVGGEAHPFSMASATAAPELRFAIKDLGDYTHRMGEVHVGAAAVVEGPYGRFSHRFVRGHRQIWVAGGIGIAPFLAMAAAIPRTTYEVDLFYGFPAVADAPYLDELNYIAARGSNCACTRSTSRATG